MTAQPLVSQKANRMEFAENCSFEEFSAYLQRIGQYTGQGELEKLKDHLTGGISRLIVFREGEQIVGHAI